MIALGLALFVIGDAVAYNYEPLFGGQLPFPSIADPFYLAMYPCLAGGLLLLLRRSGPLHDRATLIDALVVTIGAGTLSWVFLMAPYAHDDTLGLPTKLTSLAYPVMDLLLLAVGARVVLGVGARRAQRAAPRRVAAGAVGWRRHLRLGAAAWRLRSPPTCASISGASRPATIALPEASGSEPGQPVLPSSVGVDIPFTTFRRPLWRSARSSSTGLIMWHGPHQAAQKSTTTGTEALVSASNALSSASTTQGSGVLHFAHRGLPRAIGPTRLRAPQDGRRGSEMRGFVAERAYRARPG